MASTPRRSMRRKDDNLEHAYPSPRTRNQNSAAKTPKDVIHSRKKLNISEICKNLELSDDETKMNKKNQRNVGKNQNTIYPLTSNASSITVTIRRLSGQNNYKVITNEIGTSEKKITTRTTVKDKNSETPGRLTKSGRSIISSYNEDDLIKINEKNRSQKDRLNSTPNVRKRSMYSTRLRYENSKQSDNESDNEEREVDENEMYNANANLSPKRLKSENNLPQTPRAVMKTPSKSAIKNLSLVTPTKALSKLQLDEPRTPRTRQRSSKSLSTPSKVSDFKTKTPKSSKQIAKSKISSKIYENHEKKRSTKSSVYDDDDYQLSESEISEDDNYESETSSSESQSNGSLSEEIYSPKRKRVTKKITMKTPSKNKLKTPSKSAKTPSKVSMETPTKGLSRLSLKNSLTPSVQQRTANIMKPSTPLQEARLKLHVSVLPKSLPCREEQFNDIYSFLHARLSDSSGGCIYISGVPGTGKTATVTEVIRCLKKLVGTGKLTKFDFIDINGMKLSEPRQAYVQIWKQLTGQTTTWEEAQKLLQDRFTKSNSKREMTLLLVDELDLLCTKRQDVVYNLLDWPSKTNAKLVVVTIANTMDLPERILMGKVTSRLGLTRLTFPPYNHKQLEEIVASRLKGFNAFSGETVQLVARKVAAVSGDARRALDICRRATEVAESNNREMVSMIDVKRALDEMIASPKIQAIKHCSDIEKIFLQAVCAEVTRTGVEEVLFKNVYFQLKTLCTFSGEITPNITEALSMCARLGSWRLLSCDHSRMDIHQRLLLNVLTDDVHFATQTIEA